MREYTLFRKLKNKHIKKLTYFHEIHDNETIFPKVQKYNAVILCF